MSSDSFITRLLAWILRRIDARMPPGSAMQERQRGRLLLMIRDIMLVATTVGTLVRLVGGLAFPYVPAILGVIVFFVPGVYRATGSVRAASHLLIGSFVLGFGLLNVATGGVFHTPQTAATVFPLLAVFLLGTREALGWTVIGFVQLLVGLVMQVTQWTPLIDVGSAGSHASIDIAPIVLIWVVHGVAGWFDVLEKQALSELRAARDKANRANDAKTVFLGNLTHELRTPMNGVLGALEIIDRTNVRDEQEEYVKVGQESARHMLRLINDILDVSKLEAGAVSLEFVTFDLEDVARSVLDLQRPTLDAKKVNLRYMSDLSGGKLIIGDALRIRQILTNLVGNACKFTEEGQVSLFVHTEPSPSGRLFVRIQVRDTGIGILPDRIHSIFDAFIQADASTTRRFGGTGLGLHITRRLVEEMGGSIEVVSVPDEGSTFTVEFETDVGDDAVESSGRFDVQELGLKVLVVEDNRINRMVVEKLLDFLGCERVSVDDGRKAMDTCLAEPFDLVLMDCEMPEMDGYEATRALREAGMTVPILALTAHAGKAERRKCVAAGMDEMLSKPVTLQALSDALNRYARQMKPALPADSGSVGGEQTRS